MALRSIPGVVVYPVTAADARAHVRLQHTQDDAQLDGFIAAACGHLGGVDGITGRALVRQAYELRLDAFPSGALALPLPPLVSVEAVQYIDTAGTLQTLAAAAYEVDTHSEPGLILPASTWPLTADKHHAVRVRFTAGYDAATLPPGLRAAVLMLVADLDANRAARSDRELFDNPAADAMAFPFRLVLP
jgi:uncharacterized phiE125 gp8 family phage protein